MEEEIHCCCFQLMLQMHPCLLYHQWFSLFNLLLSLLLQQQQRYQVNLMESKNRVVDGNLFFPAFFFHQVASMTTHVITLLIALTCFAACSLAQFEAACGGQGFFLFCFPFASLIYFFFSFSFPPTGGAGLCISGSCSGIVSTSSNCSSGLTCCLLDWGR